MAPIAKAMNAAERGAAAAYYAKLPFDAPSTGEQRGGDGAVLATRGRWDKTIVPACEQCHGPRGVGVGEAFPPLAGQPAVYIGQQLRAWQQGTRPPGPLGLMKAVATRLSEQDVDSVAHYFGVGAQSDADRARKP
jgi:cytochrome c553